MSGASIEVTVVIPTRNRVRCLSQALASALGQEDVSVQAIVVDEGSSDGTQAYLAAVSDPRVEVVRHEKPGGPSAARNAGIALAKGAWIAFLDDDDLWGPPKLRSQLDALAARPECRWACVGAVHVDASLQVVGAVRLRNSDRIVERLLERNVIPGSASAVMVDAELLRDEGGFREDLSADEDWECWIRLAERSPLAVVDRPLTAYRMDAGSRSHDVERQAREEGRVRALHAPLTEKYSVVPDTQFSNLYRARQEMRLGRRLRPARRFVAAARPGRPRYLLSAAAALVSPRATSAIGMWRWRRSLDPDWLEEATRWLARYEGGEHGGG